MLLYDCYVETIPKISLILLELRLKIIYFIIILYYIIIILYTLYIQYCIIEKNTNFKF